MIYSTSDLHIRQRELLNLVDDGEEVIVSRRKNAYKIIPYGNKAQPIRNDAYKNDLEAEDLF
jgi:hypothetical protein